MSAPCATALRVVGVDVVHADVEDRGGVAELARHVDAVDVVVGVAEHHDAVAESQPGEHLLTIVPLVLHAGLPQLGEAEHAHEVVERGELVGVGESGIDVGHADAGLGLLGDGRHELLLLARQHRGVARVVGQHVVGAQPAERFELVAHSSILSLVGDASRSRARARLSRDLTVPTGMSRAAAIWLVAQLLPHVEE